MNNFCTEKLYGLGGVSEKESFCIKKMATNISCKLWCIHKQIHPQVTRKQTSHKKCSECGHEKKFALSKLDR